MNIHELKKYILDKIDDINNIYPNFINDIQKDNYINSNINSEMTQEQIDKKFLEIDDLYNKIIKKQEKLTQLRKELYIELENKKEELKNVNKTFGEVYKAYVIHILKMYEDIIDDNSITLDAKNKFLNQD